MGYGSIQCNMIRPERPVSGQKKPRGWDAQLWDWIQSMDIAGDKKTIFVKPSTAGKMISAKSFTSSSGGGGAGTAIGWAKITAVADANNYTASIWADRNEVDPSETDKVLYVYDIADALAVNDWIPVQASNMEDKDYENIQQLGIL